MHLLRTRPLIEKLARGQISNLEKAYYLLASFLMFPVVSYSGFVSGNMVWTLPSVIEGLAIVGIMIIGIVKAFDAAGGEEAPDFIAQFTCLYVPISISAMLVAWSLFWGITLGFRESLIAISQSHMQFAINLSRIGADMATLLAFVASVGVQIATFYRMSHALATVRALRNSD